MKSAALFAVVVLACGCQPRETEAGGSVSLKGDPRGDGEQSSGPTAASAPSNARHVDTNDDRSGSGIGAQELIEDADTASPKVGTRPERPWAHNTGPSDPEALIPSESIAIKTDGAVVENVDVTGRIKIDADDITVRNFRVHGAPLYGIQILNGHSGIVIEDGEIYDVGTGILGVGYTGRRLHIHDSQGDATKAQGSGGPTLVEYSFFEKLGKKKGSHADGNQTIGGSNITFRYNNIWMPAKGPNYPGPPYNSNAAFMNSGTISNFIIEHNWLNGGNYTIYCGKDASNGVSVRYNLFGRDYRFGTITGRCKEAIGNVWEDTGDPI